MPSKVLNGTPLSILFPQKAPYSLAPHIFGYLCLVRNCVVDTKKLDPKAIRAIFFGYSPTQKGYKYCDPKIKKWYVCRDVTFIEHVFYFAWTSLEEKCDDKDEQ